MRRWPQILRWTGIGAAITAALAGLLLLSAYFFVQSETGRAWMLDALNRRLGAPGETRVHIGGLEGDLLDRIALRDLTVDDGDGTWLRLKIAHASWRPAALLAGTLSIANLKVDGLTVLRRPRHAESTGKFHWPESPIGISVERFSFSDAVLESPVFGEKVAFRASGDTAIEGIDRLRTTIDIVRTDGVSGRAQLDAVLQPHSKFLRFQLALNEAGGGIIARVLDLDGLPSLSIQADGEGPFDELVGNARVRAGDLGFVESRFTIAVVDRPALKLEGRARIARLVDEPLRQLLSGDVVFDVQGELEDDGIVLRRGIFANNLARTEVSGELRDFAADFNVTMAADDLAPLSGLAGIPLHGRASVQARIRSDDVRRSATASATATLLEPLVPSNPWHELVGSRVTIAGSIELDSERHWAIRDLIATGDSVELIASGSVGTDASARDGNYRLTVPRLAALSNVVDAPLAGKLTISGEVAGSFAEPTLSAHMVSPAMSVDDVVLGAIEARVKLAQIVPTIRGDLELSIRNDRIGAVDLASRFSADPGDVLRFDGLMVESRTTKLAGAMTVDLSTGTATGKLAGQELALAPWSDLLGRGLSGTASVALDLRSSARTQHLELLVSASELSVELGSQQSLDVDFVNASARVDDLLGSPKGGLRFLATDAKTSESRLASLALEVKMDDPSRLHGRLQAEGELHRPFALEVNADYSARDRGFVVTVSDLEASLSGQPVSLSKPARLEHDGVTTSLSKSTLSVAGGRLTAGGEIGAEHIGARLDVEGISLATLHAVVPMADVTGTLSGHVSVSGPRTAPTGELDWKTVDVRSAHTRLTGTPPVSGSLRGEWRDGRLRLNANLAQIAETSIDARASVPLQLEPATLALTMPANEPIDGKVSWSGGLGPFWDLFSPNEDRLTGPADLALVLDGTVASPQVRGHFQVTGGRYENVLSGTTLVDVDLRLVGDGDKLVLEKLSAGDGKKGSLAGSGFIEFMPAQSYPLHLRLEFGDMLLVARDDLTLNASGDFALEGTLSNALLSGKVITGRSGISLAGTLPPDVVALDVEEIHATGAALARITPPASAADPSMLVLDVDISVPGRAFVRGLGLDSEWQGEVKISGHTEAPNVAGVLSPVRGQFFLMGRSFRLEQGAIRFTGSDDVDPLLDLTAEHQATSLTALVHVTGSASKPKISLTSRPPLPESEIASQVLFGTDSSSLSPAQSLQLASAIATYSGASGGIGILDATRRALGVDVINFTESEENPDKTRVSIGKYITEGVYLEVEGGAEQDSRTSTTVEVEVLPNVRVEGGTTEQGGNKVGVKWKWDY